LYLIIYFLFIVISSFSLFLKLSKLIKIKKDIINIYSECKKYSYSGDFY